MKKWKEKSGYTLAELLVVVAIISVLVSISVPAYVKYVEKTKETVMYDKANQIKEALLLCEIEYMEEGAFDESIFWNDAFLKSPDDPRSALYPYVGSVIDDCVNYSVKWGEYDGDEYRIKGFIYETKDYTARWDRDQEIKVTKK